MVKKIVVTIEIPKDSSVKYEYSKEENAFYVDRVLYGAMHYPQNYGFIANTLDYDGDPLDVLVIANHSFLPGTKIVVRILGAMDMMDGGETDTKLIAVIDSDPRFDCIASFSTIPNHLLLEIEDFFKNYKNLQKKKVEVKGFTNEENALKILKKAFTLYENNWNLSKEEFIEKMKKENPEKYN